MQATNILLLLFGLGVLAFYLGRGRSLAIAAPLGGIRKLHSLPSYYGMHTAFWCALPSLILLALWMIFDDPVINSMVIGAAAPITMLLITGSSKIIHRASRISDGSAHQNAVCIP